MKLSYNPRASESVRCLSQIGRVYVLCIYRHHTLSLICPHNSINKTLYAYTYMYICNLCIYICNQSTNLACTCIDMKNSNSKLNSYKHACYNSHMISSKLDENGTV